MKRAHRHINPEIWSSQITQSQVKLCFHLRRTFYSICFKFVVENISWNCLLFLDIFRDFIIQKSHSNQICRFYIFTTSSVSSFISYIHSHIIDTQCWIIVRAVEYVRWFTIPHMLCLNKPTTLSYHHSYKFLYVTH